MIVVISQSETRNKLLLSITDLFNANLNNFMKVYHVIRLVLEHILMFNSLVPCFLVFSSLESHKHTKETCLDSHILYLIYRDYVFYRCSLQNITKYYKTICTSCLRSVLCICIHVCLSQ